MSQRIKVDSYSTYHSANSYTIRLKELKQRKYKSVKFWGKIGFTHNTLSGLGDDKAQGTVKLGQGSQGTMAEIPSPVVEIAA